jgi:mannose-6-phosphate isomerase-like protein (cupin superfamily)
MEAKIEPSIISDKDIETVRDELSAGQQLLFENFSSDNYLDEFIDKPWGHEYRVYSDFFIDIWRLNIEPHHSTSMHCHPRKETVLICLDGKIAINFFNEKRILENGDFVFLPKGVFHSTDNIGDTPAHIIEVETPRNKFDLIRKLDKYGRQGKGYETNFSKKSITPLVVIDESANRKIRDYDLNKQFSFKYSSGFYLKANAYLPGSIAVSLALEDAIAHKINISVAKNGKFEGITPEKHYFTIEKNA